MTIQTPYGNNTDVIVKEMKRCPHCGYYHSDYKTSLTLKGVKYYCAKCGKEMK